MNISEGSPNAIQLALQTLKDRCHEYQHQVRRLEEEILALRLKCDITNKSKLTSLTEIDRLNARITELNEQNNQHLRNNAMVTTENRNLWSQLSSLCIANKTMGDHIAKVNNYINEPYTQSHTALIRSKTFTHETPAKYSAKLQNDESSLELEEVSLKTGECNIVDIPENFINSSFAFSFHNDASNNSTIEYCESNLDDLKIFKDIILHQNLMLRTEVNNLSNIKIDYKCGKCSMSQKDDEKEAKIVDTRQYAHNKEDPAKAVKTALLHSNDLPDETSRELDSLANWGTPENSNHFFNTAEKENRNSAIYESNDQICPMCNQLFSVSIAFDEFHKHVEEHFLESV